MSSQSTTRPRRRMKRGAFVGLALLALPVSAWAYEALNVDIPLMPAVGENNAGACDTDGVTTSYTYGSTSKNGVRITRVNVSGVAANCSVGTVSFMNDTTEVAAYSGSVTSGLLSLPTNISTNEFTSVRVALYP